MTIPTIFVTITTVFILYHPIQLFFGTVSNNFINGVYPECPNTSNRILTVPPGVGRLGNTIWEYMSLVAFQKVYLFNGTIFLFSSMKRDLQDLFDRIDDPNLSDIPESCIKRAHIQKIDLMEKPKFLNFSRNNLVVSLDRYSCRYTDMIDYGLENIRQKLRFHQKLIDKETNVLKNIKATFGYNETADVTFIGVHYRGGGWDYNLALKYTYKKKFVGPPTFLYYRNAMDYFKITMKNPIFVFITIDKVWAAENLRYLENFKIYKHHPKTPVEDLVILSLCNHSIINYGTYGATGALFANGITFVYDLKLPNDGKGFTLAQNMAQVVPNWFLCDERTPCNASQKNQGLKKE